MSHSSVTMQTPNPMRKKVIAALVAVVIGHIGVLWTVSQMKVLELQKIEKKPVQVKFLKIKEDVPPPPPPPSHVQPKVKPVEKPIEPKVEPKPVVEKKIIATKTEKVEQKKVQQDDTLEKQKLEQQKIEQQRQDQLKRDQDARDKAAKDQAAKEQAAREQAARDQARRDQEERDRIANLNKPRNVSEGQVSWSRQPSISSIQLQRILTADDGKKTINLEIQADATGKVSSVKIIQSSGNSALDSYVVKQTYAAKFKPYKESGVGVPFKVRQDFTLAVTTGR